MGNHSDFIVADRDAGAAIAAATNPSAVWQTLEGWKGVDAIKLATLCFIISEQQGSIDEIVALSFEFVPVEGNPDEGPWVHELPARIQSALASLPPGRFATVAAQWCATEEMTMDGWSQADAETFLRQIQSLVQGAVSENRTVFLLESF